MVKKFNIGSVWALIFKLTGYWQLSVLQHSGAMQYSCVSQQCRNDLQVGQHG